MSNQKDKEKAAKAAGGRKGRMLRWMPLGLLLVLLILGVSQGWHHHLSLSEIIRNKQLLQDWVVNHPVRIAVVYMTIYIVAVAVSFPGASLITIAGGFMFGWLFGGMMTIVSATIGATVLFIAARSSLGATLKERAGPFIGKMASGFRQNAFSYLLFLRLTPVFPFWLVNIAPALFNVSLPTYLMATFIGILPGTFAYTFVGAGLGSVVEAQEALNPGCAAAGTCEIELRALITPEIVWALIALGIVALIPALTNHLRQRLAAQGGAGEPHVNRDNNR
ncbi:TVP38/TMEM64 family protein [Pseudovibrio exalbescens]|uniref:TVP38/TMEM64 family membrane protein n=1 Tax=Pseudovibrio exalbescens TaxID=197461 RepID=A0A1U7JHJ8_9HYPH|nr:TVP38/TMEM64 family protein [Pseudovibrio exalbescens]OKL44162.1 mercuric reductase [Pseudovibrio exalbescens]